MRGNAGCTRTIVQEGRSGFIAQRSKLHQDNPDTKKVSLACELRRSCLRSDQIQLEGAARVGLARHLTCESMLSMSLYLKSWVSKVRSLGVSWSVHERR